MGDQITQIDQKDNTDLTHTEQSVEESQTPEKKPADQPQRTVGFGGISSPDDIPLTTQNILFLQRTIGNRATTKFIQARLKVGQPNDVYEQEADRVAEQVMRMPDEEGMGEPAKGRMGESTELAPKLRDGQITQSPNPPITQSPNPPTIQRLCPQCREEMQRQSTESGGVRTEELCPECRKRIQRQPMDEESRKRNEEEVIQTKEKTGQTPDVTPKIESQIESMHGVGEPLSEEAQAYYEQRFGNYFGDVRVHTGPQAAESAKAINAKAYTTGKDIVFGAGEYEPETESGKKLLAHELTHVVQQGGGKKRPSKLVQSSSLSISSFPASNSSTGLQKYDESKTHYSYTDRNRMLVMEEYVYEQQQRERISERALRDIGGSRLPGQVGWGVLKPGAPPLPTRELTDELYTQQIQSLKNNVDAVYRNVKSGFNTQMAAFLEAYNNMKGVLDAVDRHTQQIAQLVGIFLTVVTTIAGGLVAGMLTRVVGKLGGNRLGSLLGISAKNLNEAISGGVIDGLKDVVKSTAGPSNVPRDSDAASAGFSDPESVRVNGRLIIENEWTDFSNLIQVMTNKREEFIAADIHPSQILFQYAPELASKQTAGKSAQTGSDTKKIEIALWQDWVREYGVKHHEAYSGVCVSRPARREFDVHKYILEHLEDDLGISESTVRSWAGF